MIRLQIENAIISCAIISPFLTQTLSFSTAPSAQDQDFSLKLNLILLLLWLIVLGIKVPQDGREGRTERRIPSLVSATVRCTKTNSYRYFTLFFDFGFTLALALGLALVWETGLNFKR
jgi:hypothetical protein